MKDAAPPPARPLAIFTPRQKEVGELLAHGYTGPEIADELGLATSTVENYVHQMSKLIAGRGPPTRRIALYFARFGQVQEDLPG